VSSEQNAVERSARPDMRADVRDRQDHLAELRIAKGMMRKWALSLKVPSAQHLLLTLIDPAGKTGRLIDGQKRIAARMGKKDRRSVTRWLAWLESTEPPWIERRKRFLANGNPTTDEIILLCPGLQQRRVGPRAEVADGQTDDAPETTRPRARNDATMRQNGDRSESLNRINNPSDRAHAREESDEFFQNSNPESDTESDGVPGSHATEVGDRRPRPCLAHGKCAGLPKCRYAHDLAIKIAKHLTMPPAPERTNRRAP